MNLPRNLIPVLAVGVVAAAMAWWWNREPGEPRREADRMDRAAELAPRAARELTDANVAEITRSFSENELRAPFGQAALRRWLSVDVHAAAIWISERDGRGTDELARTLAHALVSDLEFFQEYCAQLPPGNWAQKFLCNAIRELAPQLPEKAIELTKRIESNDVRTQLLQSIAADWLKRDPEAAFRWLSGVNHEFVSDEQVCAAVKTYASTDPLRAMEWLARLVRSDQLMDDTLLAVFDGWAEKKPAEAARAVALLPDDETRKKAVDAVARSWLRADPMTSYIWMKSLPEFDSLAASLPSD
jgi:hypothetical protein